MVKKQTKKRANNSSQANERQAAFVQYYLLCFNGKEAAIKAGYKETTAEQQASRLLRNVKVSEMIESEMARLRERMSKEANRIYASLWKEIDEITERINTHYEGEKKIKSLHKDKFALLIGHKLDNEEDLENGARLRELQLDQVTIDDIKQQIREINLKLQLAALDCFQREQNYFRAQELRAKLLADLFDRAGYKATDKININHSGGVGVDLSYLSDEELEQEAAKL